MSNESDSVPVEIVISSEEDDSSISVSSVIIGTLYVIGVGINIYLIADQASDGALSREVSMQYHHLRGKVAAFLKTHRDFQKSKGKVVWEAMETVNKTKGETNE